MTPEAMAALHVRCFTDAPRPWTADEFAGLLGQTGAIACIDPEGFALGRVARPEAELLTLAVRPEARRRGLGAKLLAAYEAEARNRGAVESFLEVADCNAPARALYAAAGYAEVGRRPRYYAAVGAVAQDALVLRKALQGSREIA